MLSITSALPPCSRKATISEVCCGASGLCKLANCPTLGEKSWGFGRVRTMMKNINILYLPFLAGRAMPWVSVQCWKWDYGNLDNCCGWERSKNTLNKFTGSLKCVMLCSSSGTAEEAQKEMFSYSLAFISPLIGKWLGQLSCRPLTDVSSHDFILSSSRDFFFVLPCFDSLLMNPLIK